MNENEINTLNDMQNLILERETPIEKIHGLTMKDGFKCSSCNNLSTSLNVINKQCKHPIVNISNCFIQRLCGEPKFKSWFEIDVNENERE